MDATVATFAPTAPSSSPRYRVLRRCALIAVGLVVWNVGLWFLWDFEADRRLRAFVAERRALGEPVLAEDFAKPVVVDADNAALTLTLAGDLELEEPLLVHWEWYLDDYPACDSAGVPDRSILAGILTQLEHAARQPTADFGGHLSTPAISNFFGNRPTLPVLLAKFLNVEACADVAESRIGAACQHWTTALSMVHHATSYPKTLIGMLMFQRGRERVCTAMECLDSAAPGAVLAARPQIRSLMDELLHDANFVELTRDAFRTERMFGLDLALEWRRPAVRAILNDAEYFSMDTPLGLAVLPMVVPAFKLSAWRSARRTTAWIDAMRQPSFLLLASIVGTLARRYEPSFIHHPLLAEAEDNDDATREQSLRALFHGLAATRLASIRLAVLLFEADHGCLPNTLADLVPMYIDAVPDDPFAAPGTPFHYQRFADPPRIFSVGLSGTFDGAPSRRLTPRQARVEFPGEAMIVLPPRMQGVGLGVGYSD